MTGVAAVVPGGMGPGYEPPAAGYVPILPDSAAGQPVTGQQKSTLADRLLSGARDIAEREGIRLPHATFEVRGLVAIMHGVPETGELPICHWYGGEVQSILY